MLAEDPYSATDVLIGTRQPSSVRRSPNDDIWRRSRTTVSAPGRDVLSRLLFGAWWSPGTAYLATAVVTVVGAFIGLVAGYFGGLLASLMRVVDVLLAFPSLPLTLGPRVRKVFLALIAISWAEYARIVRGLVVSARRRDYVMAAMACPGLVIGLTVLGINLLGDGLRDALDPRTRVRG